MRSLGIALAFMLLSPWLAACDDDVVSQARRQTLIIGKASGLSTIDPGATVMAYNFAPMSLSYERLLRFAVKDGSPTGAVEGELAESWRLDDDGKSWLFTLKQNHRFDDGSLVTAAAVRFSFLRTLRLGLGPAQALSGLEDVEAIDARTVRFRLAAPSPIFPLILALPPMVVINPTVLAHQKGDDLARAWLSEHTAGSGPYRVASWERGQRIVLKPNPYAAETPRYFQKIVLKTVKDNASRRLLLERGDIDIFEGVTPDMADKVAQMSGVVLFERPTPVIVALAMNTTRAPFTDIRVRKAISLAIDRRAIASGVVHGHASLITGVLPAGIPGHDPDLPEVRRDLSTARVLLKEAGIASGTAFTLSYVPASATVDSTALAIQNQLADAGLAIRLETLAPSAFAKVLAGDFDLTLSNWSADFPDPWPIMQFAYHSLNAGEGYNLSRYANAEVDSLLTRAEHAMDATERTALYDQAQRIVMAEEPMVNLFAVHGLLAYRTDVRGLRYNAWQPGIYNVESMYRGDDAP